ncbi:MAG: MFS transporter, partial [Burkholderiales bacterium]|nr:MFS transporter [Burkholderiales bacterium]
LLFGVYSGRIADTTGMRWPMLLGAVCIGLALLTGFIWNTLPAMFAVAILVGAGFVFFNVSIQSLAGGYGRPEQRARNFGMLSVGYSISTFIGPMTAGFAVEYAGHAQAFLIFALFTLLPILVLTASKHLTRVDIPQASTQKRSALDLMRIPPLRQLVIMSGLIVTAWDLFGFYVPIYAHSIGLSASGIGVILGAYAAAAFLTRFAIAAILRRWRGDRVMMAAMLLAACGFVAFPLFTGMPMLIAIAFVIGLGLGCGQPLSMMMAYERSPAGRAGEVTGLRLTANNVSRIIIPIVAGTVGTAFGAAPVFWLNALNLAAVSWMSRR